MRQAIQIQGLTKSFNAHRALDAVDLCIAEGEMVALIGASGSGKSTLLRHVAGFLPGDSGTVSVFGRQVQDGGRLAKDVRSIRAGIGFVFQQFNLVGRLSVMTNVLIGRLHHMSLWRGLLMRFSRADRGMALEALRAVGIAEKAPDRADRLSGGQQQRAAIARCLVQGASVILSDEPIASLDPESSRNVMELLASCNTERGCTVVVSLHQVDFALRYCPRTVALNRGKVVYDGPSAALTTQMLCDLYGSDVQDLFGSVQALSPAPPPMAPCLAAVDF
jgi:phosphonate transport system ATP-binding protein